MQESQRTVDANTVDQMRLRAVKMRRSPFTYLIGTLLKQFLEELDLWEEDEKREK